MVLRFIIFILFGCNICHAVSIGDSVIKQQYDWTVYAKIIIESTILDSANFDNSYCELDGINKKRYLYKINVIELFNFNKENDIFIFNYGKDFNPSKIKFFASDNNNYLIGDTLNFINTFFYSKSYLLESIKLSNKINYKFINNSFLQKQSSGFFCRTKEIYFYNFLYRISTSYFSNYKYLKKVIRPPFLNFIKKNYKSDYIETPFPDFKMNYQLRKRGAHTTPSCFFYKYY